MVIIKMWGGLGNQLFQYSFGQYLAQQLNTVVKYDLRLTNSLSSFTGRELDIARLQIQLPVATAAELKPLKYFNHNGLARIERKLAQQLPWLFPRHFVEANIPVDPSQLRFKDHCYYEGYWQAWTYPAAVAAQLKTAFSLKEISEKLQAQANAMQQQSAISIHVRRGDYVNHKYFHVCSMDYYQKAMQYFKERYPQLHFYIFTDDASWCRQQFTGNDCSIVSGNHGTEDLYLMSCCAHHIIANSTFSWWGAWLNDKPGKEVIAPAQWHSGFDGKYDALLPNDWIKI